MTIFMGICFQISSVDRGQIKHNKQFPLALMKGISKFSWRVWGRAFNDKMEIVL